MELRRVRLDAINADAGSPLRAKLDEGWIAHLVAAGPPFPPLLVTAELRLVDGWHRHEAARRLTLEEIDALVGQFPAGQLNMLVQACKANAVLRAPLADRRRAAQRLIALSDWSDRRIASYARVSPTSVGAWRVQMDTSGVQLDRRVGADGKLYPAPAPASAKRRWPWIRRLFRRLVVLLSLRRRS